MSTLLLLTGLAQAAPAAPDLKLKLLDYQLQIQDYCFPSGLRVVFQEDHTQPIVAVTAVTEGGSALDPAGREGTAHLLEHLWFRASPDGAGTVEEQLFGAGVEWNAFTEPDTLTFVSVGPRDALPTLLKLEASRLKDPLAGVDEQDLALERKVVRNELHWRSANTPRALLTPLYGSLYPEGHPYARVGVDGDSDKVTLDDVSTLARRAFTPNGTTITVVGDVSLPDTWPLLAAALPADLIVDPARPDATVGSCTARPRRVEPPPAPKGGAPVELRARVDRPMAVLAWSLPAAYGPEEATYEVLAEVVEQYLAWQLSIHAMTDFGREGGAGCMLVPGRAGSTLLCALAADEEQDPARLLQRAGASVERLWDRAFLQWVQKTVELQRDARMVEAYHAIEDAVDLAGGRASRLAEFAHATGELAVSRIRWDWLSRLDGQQLMSLGSTYVTRARMASALVRPELARTVEAGDAEDAVDARPLDLSALAERFPAGAGVDLRRATVVPDLSGLREVKLPNGLRVAILPWGKAPLARVSLVLPGGAVIEPQPGLDFASWLVEDLFPEQTSVSGGTINRRADARALLGRWMAWRTSLGRVYGINGSAGNLDGQLFLLRRLLDEAELVPSRRKDWVTRVKAELASGLGPLDRADQAAWSRVLGGFSGLQLVDQGFLSSIESLTPAQMKAWKQARVRPDGATLLIVGMVDPAAAEAAVRAWFGDWAASGPPAQGATSSPPAPGPRQVLLYDRPTGAQTRVSLVCQIAGQDLETRRVLASALETLAGRAIRGEAGLSYGVDANTHAWPGAAALEVSTWVQHEAAGEAAATLLKLSDTAGAGGLSPGLVAAVARRVAQQNPLGYQSSASMLYALERTALRGQPWSTLSTTGERLAAITPATLATAMAPCTGHEVLTVVGPAQAVTERLKAAGVAAEPGT